MKVQLLMLKKPELGSLASSHTSARALMELWVGSYGEPVWTSLQKGNVQQCLLACSSEQDHFPVLRSKHRIGIAVLHDPHKSFYECTDAVCLLAWAEVVLPIFCSCLMKNNHRQVYDSTLIYTSVDVASPEMRLHKNIRNHSTLWRWITS